MSYSPQTQTKDLYVVALSAVDRRGNISVTPAVSTAIDNYDMEDQLNGMLLHRFPPSRGWSDHRASFGRVDERLIESCGYWRD